MRSRPALALLVLAALAVPFAFAQDEQPGAGYASPCPATPCAPEASGSAGGVPFAALVRLDNATGPAPHYVAEPGGTGRVVVALGPSPPAPPPANATNATTPAALNWTVTVSAGEGVLAWTSSPTATGEIAPNATAEASFAFAVPADAGESFVPIDFTVVVGNATEQGTLTIQVVPAPTPPVEGPNVLLYAAVGGAVLLAGGAAYAVARARRPKARPRSATLQRIEMDRQVEQAKTVEEKQAIQEEIKKVEVAKSQARDLQILEAKRADVEKMIELLKRRHESGQLTRLQYERMVEKKLDELERINAELVSMGSAEP